MDSYKRAGFSIFHEMSCSFYDLLFPPVCGSCSNPLPVGSGHKLCRDCFRDVEFIRSPMCLCCGAGLSLDAGSEDRFCRECLRRLPVYDQARSAFVYRQPVSTLLLKLKFQADTRATGAIDWLISRSQRLPVQTSYDLIMPVPLHHKRLKERGLNQSLILTRLLFGDYPRNIVPSGLIRVRNNVSQTELSGRKRRRNLKNAFTINPLVKVDGRTVCLVDDVYTTGTTVSECAKTLKSAGARRVDVWTFARA